MRFFESLITFLESVLGFSPLLMLPVFVLVSMVARIFRVKRDYDQWKDFILGILCLIVAFFVLYFSGYQDFFKLFEKSLILGSICALFYQIFASFFEGTRAWANKTIDKFSGTDIDIPKNSLFSDEEKDGDN